MSNIMILLRHSGEWTSDNEYKDYAIDGIIIKDYVSYDEVVGEIMTQLGIDDTDKKIEIRYIVEGNSTPMEIRNDMGVRLYVELKKFNREFRLYPLCINISYSVEKNGAIMNFNSSDDSVSVLSSEAVVQSNLMDMKNYI
ncbi:hypothetical protein HAX54_026181 [Datura stramonium]|uniref:Uncharacterized protein n=1 Tax=Datura stramonium TaxID=4076 RepID=A0ABS8V2T2_DATST|nr:hypothetical protein [Datura stramonium]